jgi:hypothetical protein
MWVQEAEEVFPKVGRLMMDSMEFAGQYPGKQVSEGERVGI